MNSEFIFIPYVNEYVKHVVNKPKLTCYVPFTSLEYSFYECILRHAINDDCNMDNIKTLMRNLKDFDKTLNMNILTSNVISCVATKFNINIVIIDSMECDISMEGPMNGMDIYLSRTCTLIKYCNKYYLANDISNIELFDTNMISGFKSNYTCINGLLGFIKNEIN